MSDMNTKNNSDKKTKAEAPTGMKISLGGLGDIGLPKDVVGKTGDHRGGNQIKTVFRQTIDATKPLINTFKIHPEANETALMTDELFNNLVGMINEQTQLVPILLWYNKKTKEWELVDGRHRVEACNILRIKVKTFKLDKKITEDDLPMAILSIQLGNKIIDTTIASCEAVRYIERFETRGLQAELIRKFGAKLKSTAIKQLKNIRRIEPLWFETLRLGNTVEYEKGKRTNSLSMLTKICLEKEKALLGLENKDVKIGDKEIAIAFKKMTPYIDALLSAAGADESNMYAIKKLLEDKAKISLMSMHVKEELEKQRNELNKREGVINSIQRRLDAYENLFSEMQKKGIINIRKLGKLHAFKLLKNL